MGYIGYQQTKELFLQVPYLRALQDSLQADLNRVMGMDALEADALYSIAVGNHVLSDTPRPPAGLPSDATSRLAVTYEDKFLGQKRAAGREIRQEMLNVGTVIDKFEISYRTIPKKQRQMLEAKYWENATWKEISDTYKVVIRQAQLDCEKAFRRMAGIIHLDANLYDAVILMIKEADQ